MDPYRNIVFQPWMFELSMQQQSVLLLAARGPDGIPKFHPTKYVVRYYRASVLKAAYKGRALEPGEDDSTFMTMKAFDSPELWTAAKINFFESVDALPHHYYMHLLHGAQIIGYHHDVPLFRERWLGFYHDCCDDLHLTPESKEALDSRLNDKDRKYWSDDNV